MTPTTYSKAEWSPRSEISASTMSSIERCTPVPALWTSPPPSDLRWNAHHRPESPNERKMRKRHSLFGRSSSDTTSTKPMPTLHSTMSTLHIETPAAPRPESAFSERRRSKTEPLESFRNSIFGSRKKASPSSSRGNLSSYDSQPSSRIQRSNGTSLVLPREHFRSEDDCKT